MQSPLKIVMSGPHLCSPGSRDLTAVTGTKLASRTYPLPFVLKNWGVQSLSLSCFCCCLMRLCEAQLGCLLDITGLSVTLRLFSCATHPTELKFEEGDWLKVQGKTSSIFPGQMKEWACQAARSTLLQSALTMTSANISNPQEDIGLLFLGLQ